MGEFTKFIRRTNSAKRWPTLRPNCMTLDASETFVVAFYSESTKKLLFCAHSLSNNAVICLICQVMWLQQQVAKKRVKRGDATLFNDPKWPRMWYLVSSLLFNDDGLVLW